MVQAGHLSDTHPIRAAIFSADGEYFAIGTNSKSLRIYSMKSLLVQDPSKTVPTSHEIPILYERRNHHLGSIYCIDWSRSGKLIATGSNDKMVKVMSVPDLSEASESCDELRLLGHKGIVRSVSFTHDETKLLSAGQVDTCIRVWDVGTG
jgi:WD40 repeat protein